jgi:putative flippase GtrA
VALKAMRLSASFGRFLLSGGFNTIVTYGIYLALLRFISYRISYTITFVIGIALAYLLSRYFVFAMPSTGKRGMLFPVVYLVQYLVGLLVVFLWVELFQLRAALAPLASLIITMPVTFVLTRWVFQVRHEP